MLIQDEERLAALIKDPANAPLDRPQRVLVDFAIKLTLSPAAMSEQDLIPIRDAGFGDDAIHDAATITAYFNFVNRLAQGLGVALEEP